MQPHHKNEQFSIMLKLGLGVRVRAGVRVKDSIGVSCRVRAEIGRGPTVQKRLGCRV